MKWLAQNWSQVIDLAWAHLQLSLPAILLATLIAIPIGRLAFRYGRLGGALSSAATLLYAIPALPLLIIIPAVAGVPLRSDANMIIALTLYGIALLVRSAADGFASVDTTVRDASLAIGFSRSSVFWRVDLPLALPVILAGVRVVAVSTISLVTVGALIGVSSLGTLLTDGFQRGIFGEVLTGIVATIVLALVLDGLLLLLGRVLTPWRKAAA
ncbi:Glycine betaine/carnitine/choline transport system permease protein OpuCD [Leucobacter aridicollis]|uniref:ABC transporter permease n=1 Tax=Leucobacter aridicollis TaxID=283878 RepID=UPI000EB49DEC|nr:ABC transporter permease subunit [Leucobacter aridicollis]MCS3428960.1 osmoprotectant transport system permease protein [Leucobacter aridicollis]RKQ90126.1 osmoprotectant transport system permease protein [Mycolicibacterium mucogenicum 261Sha1.1M5]